MTASPLRARIDEDVKTAMRARDRERLRVLRTLTAALKQREIDERIELTDTDVLAVLDKMVKQRREALEQYQDAGREDLAAQEQAEIEILGTYLPEPLSESELDSLISAAIDESGASSARDMGRVIGLLKPAVQGRADMAAVSRTVKARLS